MPRSNGSKAFCSPMSFSDSCVAAGVGMLNAGGKALRLIGMDGPSLELEPLKKAARRRTGLSDFGEWAFEEPLERLLDARSEERRAGEECGSRWSRCRKEPEGRQ